MQVMWKKFRRKNDTLIFIIGLHINEVRKGQTTVPFPYSPLITLVMWYAIIEIQLHKDSQCRIVYCNAFVLHWLIIN